MGLFKKTSVKKATLQRFLHSDVVTLGKLSLEWIPNHKDIYTLELPAGNGGQGFCIPQGLYNCTRHKTTRHPNTWALLNVPGREGILFHAGNYPQDTEGCILVGLGIEEHLNMITKSILAMQYMREVIGEDNFSVEVRD